MNFSPESTQPEENNNPEQINPETIPREDAIPNRFGVEDTEGFWKIVKNVRPDLDPGKNQEGK